MSNFVIHSTHELHQLKSLAPPPGRYDYLSALSFQLKQKNHSHFVAPVSHCGAGAFIVCFSGKLPKYVAADPSSFRFTRQSPMNRNGGT